MNWGILALAGHCCKLETCCVRYWKEACIVLMLVYAPLHRTCKWNEEIQHIVPVLFILMAQQLSSACTCYPRGEHGHAGSRQPERKRGRRNSTKINKNSYSKKRKLTFFACNLTNDLNLSKKKQRKMYYDGMCLCTFFSVPQSNRSIYGFFSSEWNACQCLQASREPIFSSSSSSLRVSLNSI